LSRFPLRLAVFASGSGSNAERFFQHFQESPVGRVSLLAVNRPDAGVVQRAANYNIPTFHFTNRQLAQGRDVLHKLQEERIDFIVLAGFMRLIPDYLVEAYPNRIVNIHPALLPKWGGKGMYGHHVHQAVKNAGDTESGISIHYVNQQYDEGAIIFQASCPVLPEHTAEEIGANVLKLEHQHYPRVVEDILRKEFNFPNS
jgi:phosphoribosylglycinamide formyltransferase-1